jgi:hypothetical protein
MVNRYAPKHVALKLEMQQRHPKLFREPPSDRGEKV